MGASPLLPAAKAVAAKYGIPEPIFLRQINQESGWNPNARSSAGAAGLLQLMPGTARSLGVTNPFDPHQSLEGGARYLREQFDRFGNWRDALAAYNAGPGNVASGAWQHIPETVRYVQDILQGLDAHAGTGPRSSSSSRGSSAAPVKPQGLSQADLGLLLTLINGGAPSANQLLSLETEGSPQQPVSSPLPAPAPALGSAPVDMGKFERVDQGVDYMSPKPVGAVGPGRIISITKGMAGGTGDIIKEQLARPVSVNGRTYRYVYYSEESPLVRQGQQVAAGQPVMAAGGNELGFLDNQGRMAPLVGGLGAGTQPTQMGADFLAFLRKLARGH